MISPCCEVRTERDGWGHTICTRCWGIVRMRPRAKDIIDWLFPPESGERPQGEPVFVRYGNRIELLNPGAIRGKPDSWSWTGA